MAKIIKKASLGQRVLWARQSIAGYAASLEFYTTAYGEEFWAVPEWQEKHRKQFEKQYKQMRLDTKWFHAFLRSPESAERKELVNTH